MAPRATATRKRLGRPPIKTTKTRRVTTAAPKRSYTRRTVSHKTSSRVSNEQIMSRLDEVLGILRQHSPGDVEPLARTGTGGD